MTKDHYLMQLDPSERIQALEDTADKVEQTTYLVELTQEELDQKREQLADNSIKLSDLQVELKRIASEYKEKMKPFSEEIPTLLQEIKTRQTERDGVLYHLADHDRGVMDSFDERGELIATRRLRPDERQATLFVQKPATA